MEENSCLVFSCEKFASVLRRRKKTLLAITDPAGLNFGGLWRHNDDDDNCMPGPKQQIQKKPYWSLAHYKYIEAPFVLLWKKRTYFFAASSSFISNLNLYFSYILRFEQFNAYHFGVPKTDTNNFFFIYYTPASSQSWVQMYNGAKTIKSSC